MGQPEHIGVILRRVFEQLEKNSGNDKEMGIEAENKTDDSAIAE